MSTEEEQFLALLKENLRAHQNIASIVINYTCCSVHNVGTLNFTTDGGGRVAMRQSDAPQSQEVVTLPDELATDEAIHLWQKLQEADYIDENYQPLVSRPKAALLADAMATCLGIRQRWRIFEEVWQRRNMRNDFARALSQQQSLDFQDDIRKLIRR